MLYVFTTGYMCYVGLLQTSIKSINNAIYQSTFSDDTGFPVWWSNKRFISVCISLYKKVTLGLWWLVRVFPRPTPIRLKGFHEIWYEHPDIGDYITFLFLIIWYLWYESGVSMNFGVESNTSVTCYRVIIFLQQSIVK